MGSVLLYAVLAGLGFAAKRFLGKKKPMDEETAATKVQSIFRGHKARKEAAEEKEAATKIQAVYRGKQARKKY
eukprot:CAMPEP_0182899430 /NCGR_PEP_ID=MMETSP0034_2-20130328/28075_1 /TAXON_ID=156128 /ORGANISM="Nephroselmis pyriformis, Strain CCMP717" /LENGTH=72 /DNA_ID=CAMNT_0025033463 /DNA_START=96 /DNA_END=314 /DNA_ORIENTATION=+